MIDETIHFTLLEFNPRRAARGAEAAKVRIDEVDGSEPSGWLWMSVADIKNNIREFGAHAALNQALEHYRTGREFKQEENA